MSFDTTAGTRGRRQRGTGGPVGRWIQKRMVNRVRRTGRAMGNDGLVLTTVGRKSGTERTTAVMCFPGEDGSWLIVASAAGAAKNPAWYYNIAAHPDKVQIERPGRKTAVTAEQLHGSAREQAWQQITKAQPRFGSYQQSTDRELPVIRLVPRID